MWGFFRPRKFPYRVSQISLWGFEAPFLVVMVVMKLVNTTASRTILGAEISTGSRSCEPEFKGNFKMTTDNRTTEASPCDPRGRFRTAGVDGGVSSECATLDITDRQLEDLVTHEILDDWTVVGSSRLFRTCQVREYPALGALRKFSGSALKWSFFRKGSRREWKAAVATIVVLPARGELCLTTK